MTTFQLIRPTHLNQYGTLFGGYMLQWVDEAGWMAVSTDFPGMRFVTIGLDEVVFKKQVSHGTILCFETARVKTGNTSITYAVNVHATHLDSGEKIHVFSTQITFVRIDAAGQKTPLANPPDADSPAP